MKFLDNKHMFRNSDEADNEYNSGYFLNALRDLQEDCDVFRVMQINGMIGRIVKAVEKKGGKTFNSDEASKVLDVTLGVEHDTNQQIENILTKLFKAQKALDELASTVSWLNDDIESDGNNL